MARRILAFLLLLAIAAALVAAVVHGYEHWRGTVLAEGMGIGEAKIQKLWDEDRAKAQENALENARLAAKETTRRLEAQERNQRAQDELLARTRADRDRAVAAADGLRLRASAYLDAAGCGSLSGDPALECVRKAAAALGDALGRSGEIARRVAADADDARARGLKCEADYDSLTLKADTAAHPQPGGGAVAPGG